MAPNSRPNNAPRMTARRVNSLILSSVEMNGRNSPGGAVELHGRSLKEASRDETKLAACGIMPHARRAGKQILGGEREFQDGNAGPTVLLTASVSGYIVPFNNFTG